MRIAQIAPVEFRTPPKKYGSIERLTSFITEELVRRGHDVTLFASGDSITKAKLDATEPVCTSESGIDISYVYNAPLLRSIGHAYKRAKDFDIIHHHVGGLGLPLAELSPTRVVLTLHGTIVASHEGLYREFKKPYLVAISKDQQKDHIRLGLNSAGIIHHGVPLKNYPFSPTHENYLLNVGSIWKGKGTHHALNVARALNMPLIIAARLGADKPAQDYYKGEIEPYLNDQIRWIGEVSEEERNKLMSKATALIHGRKDEPFGLVLIEAMGCGLPVVGFNTGSVPEIVEHGKTGFVVGTEEEMIEAVKNINTIDRAYVREYALKNFGVERMVDQYEEVYKKILASAW
jgi:glycosyltransferase involved in cell wall biosynthesis